jgi:hypothetical protein
VIFGHAIYESLVLGVSPAAVAAAVMPRIEGDVLRSVDRALASALEDSSMFSSPTELRRVDLDEAAPR